MKTLITNIGQIASGDIVATDARATHRIIVGNDAPSGTGVIPLGVLRTLSLLAGLGGMDPAQAIACATGNTARVYKLNVGVIAQGARRIS